MTIANTTAAAAPTNRGNSEQKEFVLFGRASNSQTSQVFTVDQMPFYLSAFNLGSDDTITVQQVYGSGSGVEVGPFAPIHGVVQLTQQRTKVMVDYPGRYQLLHAGSSALGTFTVTGFAASMTSDPISDVAEALSASIGQFVDISQYNYIDLGTNSSGTQNIDWTQGRAQKVINASSNLNVNIHHVLPSSPGLCIFLNTENSAGNKRVSFIGSNPAVANIYGTTPPSLAANAATFYIFWFDGTNFWLIDFSSFAESGSYVGRFTDSTQVICGDNIARTFTFLTALYNLSMTASGTDTYTASSGDVANYQFNSTYTVTFTNANTGAATLNINSFGALAIQRRGVAVTAGQIPAGSTLQLFYNGTNLQIMGAA